MRRMQLMVEERQYQLLRAAAEREKKTISAVLRQIISRQLESFPENDPLLEVTGIARTEQGKSLSSETIDQRLYGK